MKTIRRISVRQTDLLSRLLVVLGLLVIVSGCGKKDGPSDYDKLMESKQVSKDAVLAAGGKIQEKKFAIGTGWVVDLHGAQITNELLQHVKSLGNVAELNLSKSTITDEQLGVMHDLGFFNVLNRFDLSSTGITDAGLEKMKGFVFLAHINLTGTKVTAAGAERFRLNCINDPKAKIKNTVVKLK